MEKDDRQEGRHVTRWIMSMWPGEVDPEDRLIKI